MARALRTARPELAVIDWDDFMPAVEALTGRDVRGARELWAPYRELVRSVVVALGAVPTVVFGVCTPDELLDWPDAEWIVLDCEGDERRRRLSDRPVEEANDAVADAFEYRRLGLRVLNTSGRSVEDVVRQLALLLEART